MSHDWQPSSVATVVGPVRFPVFGRSGNWTLKHYQNWGNVQTPGCAEEQGVMLAQFYLMVNARSKKSKEKR